MRRGAVRLLIFAALAAIVFGWGLAAGNYHIFPWEEVVKPVGQTLRSWLRPPKPEKPPKNRVTSVIGTGLVNFDFTVINAVAPLPGQGGSLGLTGDGLAIVRDQSGRVAYYDKATDTLRTLKFLLPPLNIDAVPARTPAGRIISRDMMRYQDVEIFGPKGAQRIAVHHLFFKGDEKCTVARLEIADLPADWTAALADGETPALLDWKQLYETTPCLPISESKFDPISGNQAGGRILVMSDTQLLVTTGDLAFDGLDPLMPKVAQLGGSLWGRVLSVDLTTGAVTEYTKGHRNPQAFTRDAQGRLWIAEHAPRGGDELNLIEPGNNYGWPEVTLGVNYIGNKNDWKMWPANQRQGRHDGYTKPVFAFMPSIAPSSMKLVAGLNERWDGDLLISTLIGQALYRVRLEGDHVLYAEPIPMQRRIRDLEIADGRIYLLFDDGTFGYMVPHDMQQSETWDVATIDELTRHGCVQCHSAPTAPALAGALKRDIASQEGIGYSAALKAHKGKWTVETLTAFLNDPQAFAPGTTMPNPGLTADEIAAVIKEISQLWP